jgi:hypothetical protein
MGKEVILRMTRHGVIWTAVFLIIGILACNPLGPAGETTATNPTPHVIGGEEVAPVPVETEAPVETALVEPAAPLPAAESHLSATGPWLVYEVPDGLAAVNADGTGYTLLLPRPTPDWTIAFSAAPAGGHVGVFLYDDTNVTMAFGEDVASPPYGSFWVIALPDGTPHLLVAEAFPPGSPMDWSEMSMPWDFFSASGFGPWTSDGASALITSAHEGNVDLYRLDVASMQLTRISDGPAMAFRPRWSPDERYILWEEVRTFGTGAGYSVAGLWTAPADGSAGPTMLADSEFGGDYIFLGWRNDAEFAFTVFDIMCGHGGAWLGSVETAQIRAVMDTLNTECMLSIDYSPTLDDFLFTIGDFDIPGATLESGLYHLTIDGTAEYLTPLADPYLPVMWSDAAGTYLLTLGTGQFERYPPSGVVPPSLTGWPESLARSPDGEWLAISASGAGGILVGRTLEDMTEINPSGGDFVWTPDSTGLFVATAEGLALVDRDTGALAIVQTTSGESLAWAYP